MKFELHGLWMALGCKTSPVYAETMRDICRIAGLLKLLECQAKIHTSPNCTQNALWDPYGAPKDLRKAIEALTRHLRSLHGFQGPYKALKSLTRGC